MKSVTVELGTYAHPGCPAAGLRNGSGRISWPSCPPGQPGLFAG